MLNSTNVIKRHLLFFLKGIIYKNVLIAMKMHRRRVPTQKVTTAIVNTCYKFELKMKKFLTNGISE